MEHVEGVFVRHGREIEHGTVLYGKRRIPTRSHVEGPTQYGEVLAVECSPLADDLISRLKRQESQAMTEVYDRYKRYVCSIIYHVVHEYEITEDLSQEAFWTAWKRIQTFDRRKGDLKTWIGAIARNRAIDHLRSIRNDPLMSSDFEESRASCAHSPSPGARIEREDRILHALKSLGPAELHVIQLLHYQGLTQVEIAKVVRRPIGTVKTVVRRAFKVMRGSFA